MEHIGSELEWLYYNLWVKCGPSPTAFVFYIPEAVFFRNGKPDSWYFTSKDGYILKKNKINVTAKQIHQSFSKHVQQAEQVTATAYHYRKAQSFVDLSMDYIAVTDFRSYMFFNQEEKPQALQKYTQSQTSRNSVIKYSWSNSLSVVERLTNNHSFYDTKLALHERIATFDGANHLSKKEDLLSKNLLEDVNSSVRQIRDHLLKTQEIQLLKGNFFFKRDKSDKLVLLFATQIKVDKSGYPTLDQLEVRLKQWAPLTRQNQIELPQVSSSTKGSTKSIQQHSNKLGQKVKHCPFCSDELSYSNCYELTTNQILKLRNHYEEREQQSLEEASSPQSHSFKEKLHLSLLKNRGQVPDFLLKLHPNLTFQKYQMKKNDPLFLYSSIKLCEGCYMSVKDSIQNLQSETTVKLANINKPTTQTSKIQMRQSNRMHRRDESLTASNDIPGMCFSDGGKSDNYQKAPSLLKPPKAQQGKHIRPLMKSATAQKRRQDMLSSKAMSENGSNGNQLFMSEGDKDMEIRSENPSKGFIMFGKVEAGKEVSEKHLFNIPMDCESQTQSNNHQSCKVSTKSQTGKGKSSFQIHQNEIQQPSFTQGQKQVLPKINWEKEYMQSVKAKTKKAKGDILDAIDLIQSGSILQKSEKQENQLAKQNIWDLGNPQSQVVQRTHQQNNCAFKRQVTTRDDKSSRTILKENQNVHRQQKRPRPFSSKPPLSNKSKLHLQMGKTLIQQQSRPELEQTATSNGANERKEHPVPGPGFLDFENMNSNDIQTIALNADSLINIIKNIKDSLGQNHVPTQWVDQNNQHEEGETESIGQVSADPEGKWWS